MVKCEMKKVEIFEKVLNKDKEEKPDDFVSLYNGAIMSLNTEQLTQLKKQLKQVLYKFLYSTIEEE